MKSLTIFMLLVTSQFSYALTPSESECLARNVYHEARGLSKLDWIKTANVAINRKKKFAKTTNTFGANSSNLCAIVKSREYTSRRYFKQPIKEKEVYKEIKATLKRLPLVTNALYFTAIGKKHVYRTRFKRP